MRIYLKSSTTSKATATTQGQDNSDQKVQAKRKSNQECSVSTSSSSSATDTPAEFCSTSSSRSFARGSVAGRKRKSDMVLMKHGRNEKKQSRKEINHHERSFREALKRKGLEIVEQEGDGNCLFRAVSLQVYGDSNMHGEVRRRCLDFMAKDEEHFSSFITDEPFRDYIHRKRRDGVHGNNPEIQAISELFNRPVEVYDAEAAEKPLNIFHADYKTADKPIRLSYHDGNHYNAVIDPLCPTAGLGLGLPGLEPGLADRLQKQKALLLSDIEATEFQIDQAVLEESMIASSIDAYNPKPSHLNDQIQTTPYAASAAVSNETTEYPDTVQELVMNGFELQKVIHAYELIGDDFDQLLTFLLSNSSR